jgi:hypothetical protein
VAPRSSLKPYRDEPPVEEEFPDLTDELADIVSEAMDATIAEHGLEDLVGQGDQLVLDALDYAQTRAAELVTAIDETTQERLQQMIEEAVKENLSSAELADNINNSFAFSEERADMIARTELTDAWNTGLGKTLQDAGEPYVFVTDGDGCETCAAVADDPIWTVEEFLDNTSEHPHCEREGRPLTEEEAQDMADEDAADEQEGFSARLARLEQLFYSGSQPRDDHGRWTSGGESKLSDRAQRALASHKPSTAAKQRWAEKNESAVARMLGGKTTDDNNPADVTARSGGQLHGVEVKTLLDNKNDKITVHPESRARKGAWAKADGARLHTVVFDDRNRFGTPGHSGHRLYYHEGVGAFRLAGMTPVRDAAHLRSLVAGGK